MWSWLVIFLFVLFSSPASRAQQEAAPQGSRPITDAEIQALTLAIQDEIYDSGYQKEFFDLAKVKGGVDLAVYIEPTVTAGEIDVGTAMYKLMPYGEVI